MLRASCHTAAKATSCIAAAGAGAAVATTSSDERDGLRLLLLPLLFCSYGLWLFPSSRARDAIEALREPAASSPLAAAIATNEGSANEPPNSSVSPSSCSCCSLWLEAASLRPWRALAGSVSQPLDPDFSCGFCCCSAVMLQGRKNPCSSTASTSCANAFDFGCSLSRSDAKNISRNS
ncbi:hypothetical protein DQ04_14701010 [Trypanosoma grayi]|uniref:hypothetical protein n=1 Tax=Trypanosoma grayi TaxID=71804 RepID=UPI0004F41A5A|nr:hypothetical protein DQ04_14701010 [Trypanosoma grayi]KEG06307.1 hypothetical protein DQ04_14701010 [Trypanosoma grayi]